MVDGLRFGLFHELELPLPRTFRNGPTRFWSSVTTIALLDSLTSRP